MFAEIRDRNPAKKERPRLKGSVHRSKTTGTGKGLPACSITSQASRRLRAVPPFNIDGEGGLSAFVRITAPDLGRGGLEPSRSHMPCSPASTQEASINCSEPTSFGRRDTLGAQPTGPCNRLSFLLRPECRTTTWMETPFSLSRTGPRPFERLFLSCPSGSLPLLCLPSPGGSRMGAARRCRRGFERMPTRLPRIGMRIVYADWDRLPVRT